MRFWRFFRDLSASLREVFKFFKRSGVVRSVRCVFANCRVVAWFFTFSLSAPAVK